MVHWGHPRILPTTGLNEYLQNQIRCVPKIYKLETMAFNCKIFFFLLLLWRAFKVVS